MPAALTKQEISQLPLFHDLQRDLVRELLSDATVQHRSKGHILFCEGDAPSQLFVLIGGLVELFTQAHGRETVVRLLRPPDTFMSDAVLLDQPFLVSARVLVPSRLLLIDASRVRKGITESNELMRRLGMLLGGQYRIVLHQLKETRQRTAPQRLAAFLLRLVDEMGDQNCVDLPMSKTTLASRLGVSLETTSRMFQILPEEGMRVRGRRVIVTDREAVERFCDTDPSSDQSESSPLISSM